jgi:hypothetical protein
MAGAHRFPIVFLALLAAACSTSPDRWLLAQYGARNSPSSFDVCKNYGCSAHVRVTFSAAEWAQVRAVFAVAPEGAAIERERIARAIALVETLVGPKAGTANDKAGAEIVTFHREGQLDCIDEAYNSTVYLRLIAADGLLRWHDVGEPYQRGGFFDRWPHNTATIVERRSHTAYTVDSWFHANGAMPETVLLKDWLAGWSPPQA